MFILIHKLRNTNEYTSLINLCFNKKIKKKLFYKKNKKQIPNKTWWWETSIRWIFFLVSWNQPYYCENASIFLYNINKSFQLVNMAKFLFAGKISKMNLKFLSVLATRKVGLMYLLLFFFIFFGLHSKSDWTFSVQLMDNPSFTVKVRYFHIHLLWIFPQLWKRLPSLNVIPLPPFSTSRKVS